MGCDWGRHQKYSLCGVGLLSVGGDIITRSVIIAGGLVQGSTSPGDSYQFQMFPFLDQIQLCTEKSALAGMTF